MTALNNISVHTSVNRLQHEVNVLQQQLSECQCLVHTLQCELQVYQRVCGTTESNTGEKQVHKAINYYLLCPTTKLAPSFSIS